MIIDIIKAMTMFDWAVVAIAVIGTIIVYIGVRAPTSDRSMYKKR